jgi:1-acyl-sn-glycerol-3-phosphate acyltransferase
VSASPELRRVLDAIAAAPEGPHVGGVLTLDAALAPPPPGADPGPAAVSRLRYEAWDLVAAHRRRGHTVVLAADPAAPDAAVAAEALGVEHVTAPARLGDGGPLLLASSFAYASAPCTLLERVGQPVALAPGPELRARAEAEGWPVVPGFDRAAGATGAARTAATYGAFLAATGVGLAAGLVARRRRTGVDAMTRTFGALGPALAGVRLHVQGREHLRERPAVFLVNHQSHLVDALVTFRLLGAGFTPVAKREVRDIPVLGPATRLADWAYVDRVGNRAQARAAIADAVGKLEQGVSVILAPEGTRSAGPRPGP